MKIGRNFATAFFGIVALTLLIGGSAWAKDAQRGEKLFGLCIQCHGSEGGGNEVYLAPSIAGMDAWYLEVQLKKFKDGLRGMHPEDTGGMRMEPMSRTLRSDADVSLVSAHIAGLAPVYPEPVLKGGDAAKGKALYSACMACHGPDASGNQAMGSGPLRYSSDWYLLVSLEKYKAGIRGAAPGDQTGSVMRGMSALLKDQQAMKDVIAYIMTLRNSK
jgi:cytochrome c553